MKKLTIVLMTLMLVGCASAKKQTTPDKPVTASATTTQAVAPASSESSGGMKMACTKAGENRILEVIKKGPGCALEYTKDGRTSAVASSMHGTKHCNESRKKIRSKLELAGFSCA